MEKLRLIYFVLPMIIYTGFAQILPPEIPWHGRSEQFIRPDSDPWITPAEKSDLTETPDYETTIDWLRRLTSQSPHFTMQKIGKSFQKRDLWMVIASKAQATDGKDPKDNKKPTLLFQAGIHSGEIDGKDAGMMFLRDIVLNRSSLLDSVNILFIPILNPDGHERFSATNRINQRGPKKMGWRTNARNLNLNRDYSKAETPEIQALLAVLNHWPIDLYIDIHVTDGIDYQYDITFGFNYYNSYSAHISQWLEKELRPVVSKQLAAYGHIPGPLIFAIDNKKPETGIAVWSASPRFSNGYGDARHLPTILIENHSLKNYRQRVLGTYVFLQAVAELLAHHGTALRSAMEEDRQIRPHHIFIGSNWPSRQRLSDTIPFLGIDYKKYLSPVSGSEEIEWLGIPRLYTMPVHIITPKYDIDVPQAYWIPASRADIIEKLQRHGIQMEIIDKPLNIELDFYRIITFVMEKEPFEGRVQMEIDSIRTERLFRTYMPGSARLSTDQPLGILAMLLLEPGSSDSFLQWGYFYEIFQKTEYIEGYVTDPLARQMMATNPALKEEFKTALAESSFASDPAARQQWFYSRSPYHDRDYLLYPVGREN